MLCYVNQKTRKLKLNLVNGYYAAYQQMFRKSTHMFSEEY